MRYNAKNKINGLWMRRIDRKTHCIFSREQKNRECSLILSILFCDFEKQIFLMFTIIHGADAINML